MGEVRNLNCKTRPVQRAAGQSAVVGAAYRAGERLFDERQDRTADFSRRGPDVRETLILTPDDAPDWTKDRGQLWNMAEAAERRKDGRPARDVQVGLAWELTPEEQRAAVVEFANKEFVSKGHVADIAFHRYGQRVNDMTEEGRAVIRKWAEQDVPFLERDECADLNNPHVKIERRSDGQVTGYKIYQPHAHIYITPRALDGDAFAAKRNRDFDRAEMAMHWRYEWPRVQNGYLEAAGHDTRVTATARKDDHRPEHMDDSVQGVARAMEMRGEQTRAREVAEFNAVHNETIEQAAPEAPKADVESEPTSEHGHEQDISSDGFSAAHRAAVAQAQATEAISASEPPEGRLQRVAAWWHNARQSFGDWQEQLGEKISQHWNRIRGGPEQEEQENERD